MSEDALAAELRALVANPLSPRETDVLACLVTGKTNSQIAQMLCIARPTVACHVAGIIAKLAVASRGEAVYLALLIGLVVIEPGEIEEKLRQFRGKG